MKNYEIDMCSGSLWKKILLFSGPLMFSNVLQVIFNISDVAVVGKFAGPIALGAVGSTTILITLFTGLFIGLGGGVNVLTALNVGAKQKKGVQEAVHTSLIMCVLLGCLIAAAGIGFAGIILNAMHTKPELITDAVIYLRLYLLGIPALAVFNCGNAILSAVGDTKRPLIYLSIAGVLNIIMNLFFVIVCGMGVVGVALASVIAQYVSAFLVMRLLVQSSGEDYGIRRECLHLTRNKVKQLLMLGIPAAFQYALFAIANIFVQIGVNSFDHVIVEGNSAATNADALVYDIMAAFYTACASFIAQNYGAMKCDRILKTYFLCMFYAFGVGLLLGLSLYVFRVPFLSLFTSDANVVEAGVARISIMALSYAMSAFMDCTTAAARGIGKTIVPTIAVIMGSVVFRIAWIYTVFAHFHTLQSLYLLYVFSWVLTAIVEIIYFAWTYRHLNIEES